jgi:hypothetical protein
MLRDAAAGWRGGLAVLTVCVLAAGLLPQAQTVTPALIEEYLNRMRVFWKQHATDAGTYIITATSSSFKEADSVEIVVSYLADDDLVTLRAFPLYRGDYLAVETLGRRAEYAQEMLKRNATAFGAYFVDSDGDVGLRFVFTLESGLGYDAFAVAVQQMTRIAGQVVVPAFLEYR